MDSRERYRLDSHLAKAEVRIEKAMNHHANAIDGRQEMRSDESIGVTSCIDGNLILPIAFLVLPGHPPTILPPNNGCP
jgi:hypothetical protein